MENQCDNDGNCCQIKQRMKSFSLLILHGNVQKTEDEVFLFYGTFGNFKIE